MRKYAGRETDAEALTKRDFERLSHFRYRLRCFLRESEEICRRHGLTSLQYQLLLHLKGFEEREWATVGELAERLQAKHHGTVMLVDRCEQLALVERRSGRIDRRHSEVHLLPKGAQLAERVAKEHQPELRHLQEEFTLPGWPELPHS
ncbi:winged helix-turn-helix transcriptional regulator [Halomonas sp. MCCC 1A11036]|uniref:Winged helix-turn-helix transcriptional regulator n=3 Tax=Halomonadaceae TaxID=28256 RepID=A0A7V7KFC4_9GAMM|nr:winged helix-turn-helix transcriptional regulator [Halomonas pellis]MCE8021814.1 winged helix-turn-helix transcriptional regulator [Halomonas zhangzhouensis]